jgi:hypothetical protein
VQLLHHNLIIDAIGLNIGAIAQAATGDSRFEVSRKRSRQSHNQAQFAIDAYWCHKT